jgi:hypothetical protein
MNQYRRRRNFKVLGGLILIGLAYNGVLYFQHKLTSTNKLDGIIGVLLGLYICSHPTANVLDILFYGRMTGQSSSRRSNILWMALNVLVLLVGWTVIFTGATRFVGRTP